MKNTPVGVDAHIDPIKNNNGITLIALVVTIIVLLILAGISLNLINSGDGIIIQARWSEFVAEYTKLDEQKELYVAAKQMDKLSEEFSKVNWRSLFTNVSYAAEMPETMYPVDLNQPFSIWDTVDTLKNTICYVEKMQYSELFDKSKVDLYRVDMSLLPNVEVRRDYIINIVSGMLYYIDGEPYKGLIYHTLKNGVPKDGLTEPIPSDEKLKITYLSGEDDGKEYTQEVAQNLSNNVTLDENKFEGKDDKQFIYWQKVDEDGNELGQIFNNRQTGVNMNDEDMRLKAQWWKPGVISEPVEVLLKLDANGGLIDGAPIVSVPKTEGEIYGSELVEPEFVQPIGDDSDYEFEGWFTRKTGGAQKKIGDIFHSTELNDNTPYAHWKKVEEDTPAPKPSDKDLTIHYLSGYTEPSYTQTVPAVQTVSATLDKCKFDRSAEGYTFLGWRNALKATVSSPYQHGGYYDVANLLVKIFDAGWQEEILDIIESYEDWETDAGGEDDGEDVTDDEPEPTMEEERRAEILDYFSGEETAIQNLFTNSTMSLNGLADWFVANQSYLATLQAYEESLDENEDEESLEVDYYDQQSDINMNGQDLWLEAVWTNEYVITLDANGGTIDGHARISVTIEAGDDYDTVIFNPDSRDGYTFGGWFTVPIDGTPFDTTTIFDPGSSPRTLYAHWVKNDESDKIVEIIFDGNGGTMLDDDGNSVAVMTQKRVIGSLFQTMPIPDKFGYIFEGWFTTPTGGTEIKSNDTVTGPMKLYAHWAEGNFVKLDLQGGELYNTSKVAWQKASYKKWNPYKFYTQMNNGYAGIVVSNGTAIGYQARGYMICSKKNKGWQLPTFKNLYAYTATSGRAYRGVRKNNNIGVKLNGKTYKKRTRLIGWYSKPNGQGNLVEPQDIWDSSKIEDPSDPTLYAYILEDLTITYDANGGYFGKASKNVTKKQKYNKQEGKKYPKIAKPKMRGYKFVGWYDAPVGGNKIELGQKAYLMSRDKVNLYAHWEIRQFKVKFGANGGSVNPTYKMVTYNTAYGTLPTPTRSGYQFEGWFTKKSGGTQIKGTEIFTRVKNQTLYAHWTKLSFKISVNNLTTNSFTMGVSGQTGRSSVRYYVNTSTSGSSYQAGTSVSGLPADSTRYVWAAVTDSTGNLVKSTNYVKVVTAHAHVASCYSTSITKYGVKKTPDSAYKTSTGNLICSPHNRVYDGGGGTKKYIGFFNNYDETIGFDTFTAWATRCDHKVQGYIQYNDGYGNDISVAEWECTDCGRNLIDMGKGATSTWTVLKCCHSVASSLICTKSTTASTQTNHTW